MNCNFNTTPKTNAHKRVMRSCMLLVMAMISACTVGPDYVRPPVAVPAKFKESAKDWKIAQPQDDMDRGNWWCLFKDPELNSLEGQLNISNQTIASAAANYLQASALVDEARASYFPTITGSATVTRQKSVSLGAPNTSSASTPSSIGTSSSGTTGSRTTGSVGTATNSSFYTHSLLLNATWEPDIWGSVSRNVEASAAGAQASAALLANTRLSVQASLAQYYFELRGVDTDQKLLDDTANADRKLVTLTQNRYKAGVAGRTDVVQAQTQLESAQAAAINNGINRALYEHAIAVLIGKPPADFSLPYYPLNATPPNIPIELPSTLLERRPDVAQAERTMAQANAQIGVAVAAYFPSLNLFGSAGMQGVGLNHWFSLPNLSWSVGPQLAETLFDGGLRRATTAAARATYEANVATYRQTVLAAYQDVEDNLASLRILDNESVVQNQAAASSEEAVKLVVNEYKAGTAQYSDVVAAMIISFADQKAADDVNYLRMTSAVGLIKALGGGWDAAELDAAKG